MLFFLFGALFHIVGGLMTSREWPDRLLVTSGGNGRNMRLSELGYVGTSLPFWVAT